MSDPVGAPARRGLALLPLAVFAGLAALLFVRLYSGDPARIPSTLIGKPAPALDLPTLDGGRLTGADLRAGHVTVLNVFASWCEPCHEEHPLLMRLSADPALRLKGVALVGLAQKDARDNIRRFLGKDGDPYVRIGLDDSGAAGIEWGVYGVPETYVVRGDGTIAYKLIGPMTDDNFDKVVRPQIEAAAR